MADTVSVIDAEGRSRFEARANRELAGYLEYLRGEDLVEYTHTFVSPEAREGGVADQLVRSALDDAHHRGIKVKATCGFVRVWISEHENYQHLLA